MTQRELFERSRAKVRQIWNEKHWNQEAWSAACRELWAILERDPDLIDKMMDDAA